MTERTGPPVPLKKGDLVGVLISEKEVLDEDTYRDVHAGVFLTQKRQLLASVHRLTWVRTWATDQFQQDHSKRGFLWLGPFSHPLDLTNALQAQGTFSQAKQKNLLKRLEERGY